MIGEKVDEITEREEYEMTLKKEGLEKIKYSLNTADI